MIVPETLLLLKLITMLLVVSVDSRVLNKDSLERISCDIPGQLKAGHCTADRNCVTYQKIVNDSALNLIEREDFIQRLQCGRYDGSEVCCSDSDRYQLGDYEDAAVCGQAAYSFRIRGGTIADIDEFPWMAMLLKQQKKTRSLYYHCGGVLIGRSFVLPADHCIVKKTGESKQDQL
ncbi:CLIP domain-containing serine protease B8-like [Ochlerotatus camptorhynchus]|uniref:CLIP domain-containing serine protease B8-like n=1 Tax=Ochlerotatus camptorhynchus TaxID=644619 RepID=UPI0031CFD511